MSADRTMTCNRCGAAVSHDAGETRLAGEPAVALTPTSIRAPRGARGMRGLCVTHAALALMIAAPTAFSQPRSMSLDHVVLAVNDLDTMSARYRQLGFSLKPGRPHANGIRNAHVKFRDGTELELLTAPDARDALTAQYRRHLDEGDGPAFLSLFPRPSAPPGGLAPGYIFFGQRNRSPTDRPEHFAHRNTADSLVAVWLAGSDFARERALLRQYGVRTRQGRLDALAADAEIGVMNDGAVYFLPARFRVHPKRPIVGVTMSVRRSSTAVRVLRDAGIAVRESPRSLLLTPSVTGGLWLEFKPFGL